MTGVGETANSVQDIVNDAIALGTPLRIAGRSHWSDAGRPSTATRIATLASHAGVVDYVPGDLTITVRAGTTLREIDNVVRAHGQWFPLDPSGNADGTIGATIATGSSGPLAHSFGRVRDLVLGVEFVTGDGKLVRGGGRVVKNVAGFDLVRLITGSWGTLGIVTEATLRLYSHPQQPVTVAMSVPADAGALAVRLATILEAPIAALAMELVSAPISSHLGMPRGPAILAEIGGNAASVAAQLGTLSRLGGMTHLPSGMWEKLRTIEDDSSSGNLPIVFRLSSLPGRVAEIWRAVADSLAQTSGAMMHATPSMGVVRCILPHDTGLEEIGKVIAAAPGVTAVYERLPAQMWGTLSPGVVSDRLSQGIMQAFDPHRILNPGILGPPT